MCGYHESWKGESCKANVEEVKNILKTFPDLLNAKLIYGKTALHIAADYDQPTIISYLLYSFSAIHANAGDQVRKERDY
jgi:ankyrin repeat protein